MPSSFRITPQEALLDNVALWERYGAADARCRSCVRALNKGLGEHNGVDGAPWGLQAPCCPVPGGAGDIPPQISAAQSRYNMDHKAGEGFAFSWVSLISGTQFLMVHGHR